MQTVLSIDPSLEKFGSVHQDPSGRLLHQLTKLYDLPETIKQAWQITLNKGVKPAATSYAYPAQKRYPCHTKLACYLEYLGFLEQKHLYPEKISGWISQEFTKFGTHHGLLGDMEKAQEKWAARQKELMAELPDEKYAYVWKTPEGQQERRYPLRNPAEVQKAASWLLEYRDHFEFDDRQMMAQKIMDVANGMGVKFAGDEAEALERQAGNGFCDPAAVVRGIEYRLKTAGAKVEPHIRDGLAKVAASVRQQPGLLHDPAILNGLGATLDQFDRLTGGVARYSSVYPRPEDLLFSVTTKTAAAFVKDACELVTGNIYEKGQFKDLPLSEVRAAFGDSFADEIANGLRVDPEKLAEMAATLPRNDAVTFDSLLAENGIEPVLKQAAFRQGLTTSDLENLAKIDQFTQELARGELPAVAK